jgi:hypothetical protein
MELTMWAQREVEQQKKPSPARQAHRREEGGLVGLWKNYAGGTEDYVEVTGGSDRLPGQWGDKIEWLESFGVMRSC